MNNIINIFIIFAPSSYEYDLYFSNSEINYKITLLNVLTKIIQIAQTIGSTVNNE